MYARRDHMTTVVTRDFYLSDQGLVGRGRVHSRPKVGWGQVLGAECWW